MIAWPPEVPICDFKWVDPKNNYVLPFHSILSLGQSVKKNCQATLRLWHLDPKIANAMWILLPEKTDFDSYTSTILNLFSHLFFYVKIWMFLKCDAFYHIEYKYMHKIVSVNECEINIVVRKHASLSLSFVNDVDSFTNWSNCPVSLALEHDNDSIG